MVFRAQYAEPADSHGEKHTLVWQMAPELRGRNRLFSLGYNPKTKLGRLYTSKRPAIRFLASPDASKPGAFREQIGKTIGAHTDLPRILRFFGDPWQEGNKCVTSDAQIVWCHTGVSSSKLRVRSSYAGLLPALLRLFGLRSHRSGGCALSQGTNVHNRT